MCWFASTISSWAAKMSPLKLDSYSELSSFAGGSFQSDGDHPRFEIVELDTRQPHNTADFRTILGGDIDATESSGSPLARFILLANSMAAGTLLKTCMRPTVSLLAPDTSNCAMSALLT